MITNEQKEQRKLGIGGSDMPVILGLSSYKTPFQLFLEKTGILSTDEEMTEAQEWGNRLEGIVRDKFADKNKVLIETPDTIIHPFNDFLRANIDGYIVEWDHGLEIKTSGNINEWGETESDYVPLTHLVQIGYYTSIINVPHYHLAVLIGHYGFKYRQYKYTRDLDLEKTLIQAATAFWDCVKKDEPPAPINQIDLRIKFPRHIDNKSIPVSNEMNSYLKSLMDVKKKMKELKEIEQESQFQLMQHMQDAECLVDEVDRPLVTWKTNKRGSRTFLLKGEK
jgi:putative phage-type endonuclease